MFRHLTEPVRPIWSSHHEDAPSCRSRVCSARDRHRLRCNFGQTGDRQRKQRGGGRAIERKDTPAEMTPANPPNFASLRKALSASRCLPPAKNATRVACSPSIAATARFAHAWRRRLTIVRTDRAVIAWTQMAASSRGAKPKIASVARRQRACTCSASRSLLTKTRSLKPTDRSWSTVAGPPVEQFRSAWGSQSNFMTRRRPDTLECFAASGPVCRVST